MTDSVTIRPATVADCDALEFLTHDLAAFHGHRGSATITAADIRRDAFGARPIIWCWIAETADGRPVGNAMVSDGYAAWLGHPIVVVNNLHVVEAMRGTGLGKRLMAEVARFARSRGIPRMELHVAGDNPARAFYEHIGFRVRNDLRCRMEADAVERLAAS